MPKKYLIGAGGWAYFRVPGLHPLKAYSMAFDFVEVNSTFYELPNLSRVDFWRRIVPPDFEFSVRCNRIVSHKFRFKPTETALDVFEETIEICRRLRAEFLHVQIPRGLQPNYTLASTIREFLNSVDTHGVRLVVEARGNGRKLDENFVKLMEDFNMVHCVDLSKNEEPAVKSDILYSRLFGKGRHNIYQPTDGELRRIDEKASKEDYDKVMLCFHFVRMYKDAARLKVYKQTGKFPMVTKSTGLRSLAEVLREDARFPATKQQLISHQGWKLIDLTKDKRIRASLLLEKLPNKTYCSVQDVVETLSGKLKLK